MTDAAAGELTNITVITVRTPALSAVTQTLWRHVISINQRVLKRSERSVTATLQHDVANYRSYSV